MEVYFEFIVDFEVLWNCQWQKLWLCIIGVCNVTNCRSTSEYEVFWFI